jgi:hypothetical protein
MDQHRANVDRQIANAQAAARRSDAEKEAVIAMQEENASNLDQDGFSLGVVDPDVSESTEQEEMPKQPPRKMRKRYLRRNGVWRRTKNTSCRVGEEVFVRDGPNQFKKIGVVNKHGGLPAAYLGEKTK